MSETYVYKKVDAVVFGMLSPELIKKMAFEEEDEKAEHHTEEEAGGETEVSTKKQLKSISSSLRNVKKCPHCGAKQFSVKIEKPTTYLEDDKRLSPIDIRAR